LIIIDQLSRTHQNALRYRAADVVSAKEATIAIDLVSVFAKEVRIENIVLKHPVIAIERDLDGRFNFEKPQAAAETFPALDWPNVSVRSIVYVDKRFGKRFEGRNCRLEMVCGFRAGNAQTWPRAFRLLRKPAALRSAKTASRNSPWRPAGIGLANLLVPVEGVGSWGRGGRRAEMRTLRRSGSPPIEGPVQGRAARHVRESVPDT
jgi:hypothetical protein